MYRTSNRISWPALVIAAFISLAVTGGTAMLFQSNSTAVDGNVLVTAKAATQVLPMREIIGNRIDVIGVRETERVLAITPAVARRERS